MLANTGTMKYETCDRQLFGRCKDERLPGVWRDCISWRSTRSSPAVPARSKLTTW